MHTDESTSRTRLLLGDEWMRSLASMRVAVFGVGGVGGWCAEALARSGAGHIMLVDPDVVAASNINRQAMALHSTIGRPKVEALGERLKDINPAISLDLRRERYCAETAATFPLETCDAVVDAIDTLDCKAALVRHVLALENVALFSSMGAARKWSVASIRTTPFRKVEGDRLAKALRKILRETGGLPQKDWTCVWSPQYIAELGEPDPGQKRAFGTVMHATAAFGLALAACVLGTRKPENMV